MRIQYCFPVAAAPNWHTKSEDYSKMRNSSKQKVPSLVFVVRAIATSMMPAIKSATNFDAEKVVPKDTCSFT